MNRRSENMDQYWEDVVKKSQADFAEMSIQQELTDNRIEELRSDILAQWPALAQEDQKAVSDAFEKSVAILRGQNYNAAPKYSTTKSRMANIIARRGRI